MERNNYNLAVQRTNDEQLLLNLVRLKYRDTPFFMEVISVSSQFTLQTNADISASLTKTRPGIFGLGAGATLTEKPTVTYSPLQGGKFIKHVLSPLSMKSFSLLYHSGWSVDRLLRLCLQRIGPLKNAPSASGPTPENAPNYREFADASKLLRLLQVRDALDITYAEEEDRRPLLIMQIPSKAWEWTETRDLADRLGMIPNQNRYVLSTQADSKDPVHIRIELRSLLGIMFYLSQAVETPQQDLEQGKVTLTRLPSGKPFDWGQVTGDLLRIQSLESRPESASIAVRYRDTWFFIDDSSLSSKSTFSLLAQIFALQAGDVKDVSPVLTLPIGG